MITLLIDVAGLEIWILDLDVFGSFDAFNNLLDKSDFVFSFDPLKPADEIFVTLPWPNLPETFEIEEPFVFVAEDVGHEVGEEGVGALDPLPWINALRHILKSLWNEIVELSVNYAFGGVKLLHR